MFSPQDLSNVGEVTHRAWHQLTVPGSPAWWLSLALATRENVGELYFILEINAIPLDLSVTVNLQHLDLVCERISNCLKNKQLLTFVF